MGPLFSVLAALVALTLAQAGVGATEPRPEALLFGLLLPHGIGLAARRASLQGQTNRARRLERLLAGSGWMGYAVLVLGAGWLGSIRQWTGLALDLDAWPDLGLLLAMAPFGLFELSAIHASARVHGGTPLMRQQLRRFQTRLFLACCAPIVLFVLLSVAVGQSQWLRTEVQYVGVASFAFTALMVAALGMLLPRLLTWSWDTHPFPDDARREALDVVAERAGFRPGRLLVWRTGDLMANAAIVGFRARGRAVLFSDHLLSLLNMRELGAVYAHEIGHARCRHVGAFIAWLAALVFLGDVLYREVLDGQSIWIQAAVGAGLLGVWYVGFGWLSRRFELEADLFSLEIQGDLSALVSALERVGGRVRDVASWRHFSPSHRVAFLERSLVDPGFRSTFKGRMVRLRQAGVAAALVGLLAQALSLGAGLPADRAVVRLARGEYAAAQASLPGLSQEDELELQPLVGAALTLPDATASAVAVALQAALEAGQMERSWALAQLAELRDVEGARPLVNVLERAREGDEVGARAEAEAMEGGWGPDLREALGRREPTPRDLGPRPPGAQE